MKVRMTTIHKPEGNLKPSERCTQHMPFCNMTHYYAVPAIEARGTWRLPDMLSNSSIENLIAAYKRAGGSFRE